ncbi:SPFH domain-containing protein [Vibrio crassostreae]|uniref:SPFH domain-containing protein n=1 Tax=Vibrio crassostreae TaxID=246167 RepID=UPI001B30AF24|nr:SPFH domain-containing protein [Vibrio crassostreae]
MSSENREIRAASGYLMLVITLLMLVCGVLTFFKGAWLVAIVLVIFGLFTMTGLTTINPNDVMVAQLFGERKGTVSGEGFIWTNPLLSLKRYDYQQKNFETQEIKINDKNGSPIIVGGVFNWRVTDAEKVCFEIHDHESFLESLAEGSLRELVRKYPYDYTERDTDTDDKENEEETLIHASEAVSAEIIKDINEDLKDAGMEVIGFKFTQLSYAPEIAALMTQRQQASATVQAKREIAQGITKVVEDTIKSIEDSGKIKMSDEDKSSLAKNMLLLLCSNREAETVITLDK